MLSAETSASFRTGRDNCRATARQNKSVRGRSSASASPTSIAVIIIIVVAVTFAVGMAQLRPHFAAPTHQDGGKDIPDDVTCTMTFRHPGYPDEHNIIMVLPALDDAQGGIHHETALIACAVVAGNRWHAQTSGDNTHKRHFTFPWIVRHTDVKGQYKASLDIPILTCFLNMTGLMIPA
jgi:hypothetical protein